MLRVYDLGTHIGIHFTSFILNYIDFNLVTMSQSVITRHLNGQLVRLVTKKFVHVGRSMKKLVRNPQPCLFANSNCETLSNKWKWLLKSFTVASKLYFYSES